MSRPASNLLTFSHHRSLFPLSTPYAQTAQLFHQPNVQPTISFNPFLGTSRLPKSALEAAGCQLLPRANRPGTPLLAVPFELTAKFRLLFS